MVNYTVNCFYDYIQYMSDANNKYDFIVFSDSFNEQQFLKEASAHREESAEYAFLYGECFFQGIGTKRKNDIALEWFVKAASQKYPLAMQHLAFLLMKMKKKEEALNCQLRAASTGNPSFEYQCGLCYKQGNGTPVDVDRAIFWFMNSAQKGYALAQVELGKRYIAGDHVKKDEELGLKYLYSAADQGNYEAKKRIMGYFHGPAYISDVEDFLVAYKCGIPPKYMTFSGFFDEKKLYQMTNRGFRKIPSYGYALSICIEQRIGMDEGKVRDPLKPLVTSAILGYAPSIKRIIKMVIKNEKHPASDEELVIIYKNAIKQNIKIGYVLLSDCYKNGKGVKQDKQEALRLLKQGVIHGEKRCRLPLANYYKEEGNVELAEYWYKKAKE